MTDTEFKTSHDELVELLLEGRINFLQYVANGSRGHDYIEWCKAVNVQPTNDTAELFCELTEIDMTEHRYIDDEMQGIWLN